MKTVSKSANLSAVMVSIAAIAVGTVSTRIGLVHTDPEGVDERARKNVVPEDVALELEAKGLVKIGKAVSEVDTAPGARLSESIVSSAIAGRVAEASEDPDDDTLISGSDTRDTTAFPTDPKLAKLTDSGNVEPDAVQDDPTAPPAEPADAAAPAADATASAADADKAKKGSGTTAAK